MIKQRFLILFIAFPAMGSYKGNRWQKPRFLHEETNVNVSVPSDTTVFLHCKVAGLRDQSVSWYRRKGSQIQLLTFGFNSYHNDERFSLMYEYPSDWRLQIMFVQDRDDGTYECQVPSDPPLIRTIHLSVIVPTIHILDDRGVAVVEKYYQTGSTIELQCVVTLISGVSSLDIVWQHGQTKLNFDVTRGGVNVRTELKDSAARSWLVIGRARLEDSGEYFCNASDIAVAKVNIHVLSDESPAAIQGVSTLATDIVLLITVVTVSTLCHLSNGYSVTVLR